MKQSRPLFPLLPQLLTCFSGIAILAGTTTAATLSIGSSALLARSGNESYDVSVNNSDAFIRANASLGGASIDLTGTIVDYAMPMSEANGAASIIGDFTFENKNMSTHHSKKGTINLWTTSDPSTDTADVVTSQRPMDITVSGSFDISSLTAGTIYFMQGAFAGKMDLEATMSDSTLTNADVLLDGSGTFNLSINVSTREDQCAVPMSFKDAAGYDTITFTWTSNGKGSGRFGGAIVSTAVSEPSLTAAPAPIPIPASELSLSPILGLGGITVILSPRK